MESYAVKTKLLRQDNLPGRLLDVWVVLCEV
jgi:hypothetical protein